jgi:hypothetical protein
MHSPTMTENEKSFILFSSHDVLPKTKHLLKKGSDIKPEVGQRI